MACRYTYKGKTYEAHEFDDVLRAMPIAEAAAFMPGVTTVPDAPFVGRTDAWVALAIKRVVKMAVDEGYDRVAFVTGEQSAERYDLSKQLSRIEASAVNVGRTEWEIRGFDLDGNEVVNTTATNDGLPDVVGKDVAERIVNDGSGFVTLRGLDLKVGGEGMRAFYDKIVPSVLKDVLRKVGGGQVEFVGIDQQQEISTGEDDGAGGVIKRRRNTGVTLQQPGFDITPAMREKAAGGLPLFARVDAAPAPADTAPRDAAAPTADPRLAARRNIGVLDRAIARHFGGRDAGGTELHPYEARRLPQAEGLGEIARAFGSTVQGFGLRDGLSAAERERFGFFNGVRTGGVVFIADRGVTRPHLAILGHELGHELRTRRPDLYARLVDAIEPYIDRAKYPAFLRSSVARDVRGADKQHEEFIGEVLSDGFMDREFWRALGNKNPSLLREIGGMVMRLVERVLAAVGYTPRTAPYLTDYRKVMQLAGEVMAEFGVAQAAAPIGETAFNRLDTALAGVRDLKLPAGYLVGDMLDSAGTLSWWHKTVGSMHNLAKRSPVFKRVYDAAQQFINDVSYYATEAADLAPRLLPKLETWKDIGKSPISAADNAAIRAPIFEGTLTWARDEQGNAVRVADLERSAGTLTPEAKARELFRRGLLTEQVLKMWQGMPVEQYEAAVNTRYANQVLKPGVVFTDAELRQHFNLSAGQIKLYREFRAATDRSLTNMAIADMLRYGGDDVAALREQALAAGTADQAALLLRDHLFKLAEENEDRAAVLNDTANTIIAKGDRATDLIKRGYAPLMRFGQYTLDVVDEDGERVYFGLFETARERARMERQMRANYPKARIATGTTSQEDHKLFAGISPETVELFGEMLGLEADGGGAANEAFQTYLKRAKATRSAMKRLIERKGIAGFSEDAGRVLAGFVVSNARQTSTGLHMGELTDAVEAIPQGQGQLKDAAVQLYQYVRNPQEEAQAIRGVLFAQYLGGSVASAIVNSLQPFQVTFPYLSQYAGIAGAAGHMRRAVADALKRNTGDKALDAALHVAEERGIVSPQEVHQLIGQAAGRATLKPETGLLTKADNALSRLQLAWGKVFGVAEQFNRRSTFIAAYRIAVDKGMPDPAAFAEQAVVDTQFNYTKANRPKWARGAVGAVLFTFKTYSISYVELLHRMATRGGPEGKRATLLALGVLALMSGLSGLPGGDDLDDLIDGLLQRLGYNFQSKAKRQQFLAETLGLGETGARVVEHGLSALPGVPIDVSGRLGLGNLIPGTRLLTKKQDYGRDVAEIAGPFADLAKRTFEAGGKLIQGDVGGAITQVAPLAAQNLLRGIDMANTGRYKDERGRKVIDTDGADAAVKAIGFQPADVARVQRASRTVATMVQLNKMREAEIADAWAKGIADKNNDAIAAARADLAAWNRANPESPITITMQQIRQRVATLNMNRAQRLERTASREIRGEVRRQLAEAADQ